MLINSHPPPPYSLLSLPAPNGVSRTALRSVPTQPTLAHSDHHYFSPTNPFSPNFIPVPVPGAHTRPFSPISPLERAARPMEKQSAPRSVVPDAQRPSMGAGPVSLQRLDGTPYPAKDEKPKQVKVAKDMFDGALPPVYKRQASDPTRPGDVSHGVANTHECGRCGRKRPDGQTGPCQHCAMRKVNPAQGGLPAVNTLTHTRTTSTGVASQRSIASSTTAGPSSAAGSTTSPVGSCTKCGKHKRLDSVASTQSQDGLQPSRLKVQQAGLSIQPRQAGPHNPSYPQIDIIPPSTTTLRPQNTFPSTYGEDAPLVKGSRQDIKKQESSRSFRNSSIVRSLSRRLSRREKTKTQSPPPPSLPVDYVYPSRGSPSGPAVPVKDSVNLIDISNDPALESSVKTRDTSKSSKRITDDERPSTPFSFVGAPDEEDGFEMTNVHKMGRNNSHDSYKEVVSPPPEPMNGNDEYFPNQEDKLDVVSRSRSAEAPRNWLSPDDAQTRPQITRFKSLRSGVNRVNAGIGSISRSQSLRRLSSIKTVHHAWYREDTSEHSVPVF